MSEGYVGYADAFRRLTRRARRHFVARDWEAMRADAEARLLLYPERVAEVVVRLGQLSHWQALQPEVTLRRYRALVESRPDAEIACTFYNSCLRRLLGTVGVNPATEFLDLGAPAFDSADGGPPHSVSDFAGLTAVLERLLGRCWPPGEWAALPRDLALLGSALRREAPELDRGCEIAPLPEPFIRGQRAFLVARLRTDRRDVPLLLAIVPGDGGLRLDAAMLSEDEASIVFGFTRSHFQVDLDAPRPIVGFLSSLLPAKRVDELYTVLGYHKHGKREFYQALHRVLGQPGVRFEPAEGVRGMVLVVFTLKPLNTVFKVIRDRCVPPKQITRREVRAKYQFVFLQEHGGRLADTQEFEDLTLPIGAFHPEVLAELETEAGDSVRRWRDQLRLSHLYTERRMAPLDVYLRSASPEAARAAVLDFGRAIKELAGINVFPGDMLAKNFGVTRHGRVVFYDYDEVSPLTDCAFRAMPAPRDEDDVLAAEPWFSVGEGDIFPEELERFLRFPETLHREFVAEHGDLFTADYWNRVKASVSSAGVIEPAPYGVERRLDADERGE